ncbi:FG-GAP and VCBS repeat-containing protein [Streptomyces sasae]|uniref:FG-GAP and VCBS repeat-containing protein n=1 Tax=Streptomyces sasae TaxID=1266772 RepID=UPI00292F8D24|nr:FG-GAP and VCBS repeat-containing protein [Streptomyces sasae]
MAALVGLFLAATGVVALASPQAVAATCTAGTTSDFNGDGVGDTVIADPGATVNGAKKAGLVRVILGGGKGVSEISQATSGMPAMPEAGDGFGTSYAAYDADGDGCSDLVVGTPYEDVAKDGKNLVDAGAIYIIHGTPTGIGAGSTIEGYAQAEFNPTSATEAYDWFGYALKAGTTASGAPYLVIGVPGEGVTVSGTTYPHAGCIEYAQGTTKLALSQDSAGVSGVPEEDDRFGYSLAGTNRYFAVGSPGEAIGDEAFAGGVAVFSHTLSNGMPTPLLGLDQNSTGIPGVAESGDGFGTSISMTGNRLSDQTYNSDVLLAIGMPGEDVGTLADAGGVAVVRVQPSGAYTLVAGRRPGDLVCDRGGSGLPGTKGPEARAVSEVADGVMNAFLESLGRLRSSLVREFPEFSSLATVLAGGRSGELARAGRTSEGVSYTVHGRGCRMTGPDGAEVDTDLLPDGCEAFDLWRLEAFARSRGSVSEPIGADLLISARELVNRGVLHEPRDGWFCLAEQRRVS